MSKNIEFDGHCAFAVSAGKIDVKGESILLSLIEKRIPFPIQLQKFYLKYFQTE